MPLDPKRKGDVKVIVGATVAVLLVGFFIFGAMMMTTRGGSGPTCGQLNIGLATDVRNTLENGPYFQTGGGRCGFTLALANDDIVAYKVVQPSGCTALWKFDHWECDGRRIAASRLAKYPLHIQTEHGVDTVVVNLGTPAPTSTTRASEATTTAPEGSTSVGATRCGRLDIGRAADVRSELARSGPYFQTGGAGCAFFLALDGNDIVAYRAVQRTGCTVTYAQDHWKCDGVQVSASRLARYPVALRNAQGVNAVIVDLRPVRN